MSTRGQRTVGHLDVPLDRAPSAGRGDVAPDEPVLLVGPPGWWDEHGFTGAARAAGWSILRADDVERARWLASIQRVSLVAAAGDQAFVWSVVRELRPVTAAPMVVLTDTGDQVPALVDAGVDAVVRADDDPDATYARVCALLRRADHRWGPGVRYLRSGELSVDLWTKQCALGDQPLALSPTEYALLTFLMTRPDVVLPVATIVVRVWGWLPGDGRNALRIIVNRLRRKLDDDPANPRYIASTRGIGYRFVAGVAEVADSAVDRDRVDVTPLFDAIAQLSEVLASIDDVDEAGELLVQLVDHQHVADGLALFEVDGASMRLVCSRGMPDSWSQRVAGGVPLDPTYASAHSVLSGETVQFGDVRTVRGHFEATTKHLADDGFRACHFLPIRRNGVVWGHLGLVRRACLPFDGVVMGFVRALCAVFALHLGDDRRVTPSDR